MDDGPVQGWYSSTHPVRQPEQPDPPVARDLHNDIARNHLACNGGILAMLGGLMRMMVPGRRDVRNVAAMGAANWAMRRYGGRTGPRGARAMNHASWALPLGMMVLNNMRSRRPH